MMRPKRRRRSARAFTLLEVIVALTVSAIAVTIAAAALRAGTDARARIAHHRDTGTQFVQWAQLLTQLVRHPPTTPALDRPAFLLRAIDDSRAELSFLSRGLNTTSGVGPQWLVNVTLDNDTLTLRARPAQANAIDAVPIEARLAGVQQLTARALAPAFTSAPGGVAPDASRWRAEWRDATLPTLVELVIVRADGTREQLAIALDPIDGALAPPSSL